MKPIPWAVWMDGPEPVVDIDTPLSEVEPVEPEFAGRVFARGITDAQRMVQRIARTGVVVWVAQP
jgi:hypothetical protein